MIVRSSFVHNTSQTENNSNALHCMNEQIAVYSHIAIIIKEEVYTTWNQADGFYSHTVNSKGPDMKEYT